jgi:hypothetical protein
METAGNLTKTRRQLTYDNVKISGNDSKLSLNVFFGDFQVICVFELIYSSRTAL